MKKLIQLILYTGLFAFAFNLTAVGQQQGSIAGSVQDTLGAVVVGATITVVAADGSDKTVTSNQQGSFSVNGLAPGKYTVKVIAPNFALYENTEVEVTAGDRAELDCHDRSRVAGPRSTTELIIGGWLCDTLAAAAIRR